jgi:hypothetical protein
VSPHAEGPGVVERKEASDLGRLAVQALLGVRGDALRPAGGAATPAVSRALEELEQPARELRARALARYLLLVGRAVDARWWR